MAKERKLYLTNKWVVTLFVYYVIIFLIGVFFSVVALLPELVGLNKTKILELAIMGATGMSSTGSSIFYIRKLYKLCFKEHINVDDIENTYLKRLGSIVYFLARPVFAVGFSILVVIGIQSGFMLTSNKPLDLNTGFVYITMFLSFFVGFLSGRFIHNLESSGEKIINNNL